MPANPWTAYRYSNARSKAADFGMGRLRGRGHCGDWRRRLEIYTWDPGIPQVSRSSHFAAFFCIFSYSGFHSTLIMWPGAMKQTRPLPWS